MKTGFKTRSICSASFFPGCLLFILVSTFSPVSALAANAADPQASSKTQEVLDYLTNLPNDGSSKRVVAGQESYPGGSPFGTEINDVYSQTGKYPGLWGIDYVEQNISSINNQLIPYANANGLITIVNHWNNPATGGDAWDTSNVDFTQLITNGTALNNTFKGFLDKVAAGFQTLQNNNVTVLYRPFHENNGNWFWWGAKDTTQFKNVWIYVFNYMTQTKGLHNLLWVYSTDTTLDWSRYPGSQYVDVVGVDIYSALSIPTMSGYSQLATYGKPFAITEWGACDSSGNCSSMDISSVIASIKANVPKATYVMPWAGSFSFGFNKGASTILNDPWVITRDEIVLSGTVAQSPPSPAGLRVVSRQ